MKQEFKFQGVVTFSAAEETEKDGKVYKKWQAVLEETGEQYPQTIKLDYFTSKDNAVPCPKLDSEIIAYFNLKAKEYQGRYYGENSVWRTEVVSEGQEMGEDDMPPAAPVATAKKKPAPAPVDTSDDLPF